MLSTNSVLSTASVAGVAVSSSAYIAAGEDPKKRAAQTMVTTTICSASTLTTNHNQNVRYRRLHSSVSYVESLSDEQLAALTEMLEEKEQELPSAKTLTKKL